MPEFSYTEALDTLYGFINYELKRQDRYSPDVMTLDRPRELMEKLGNPQNRYPIIHVAGTKGKGSVGAMCAAVLQASGLRVGLYSSPHLQNFRERFRINSQLIPEAKLAQIVYDIKPALDAVEGITWFEVTTALAFEYFARESIDIAVIEVGLGGRLDATNIVTPLVSVITSLSYDHMYLLGDTLASIAREKAGIIKPGVPIVSAPQEDEAAAVLEQIAQERQSPLTLVGRDVEFNAHPPALNGQQVTLFTDDGPLALITRLTGEHQAINAAVAFSALQQSSLPISVEAFQQGFQSVYWPGRLELISDEPPVVLDAAHNRASARCLHDSLLAIFNRQPLILVYGAKGDKDITGMLEELLPIVDTLILTQAIDSRAESLQQLESLARETGYQGAIMQIPVVDEAVKQAKQLAKPDGMVCVTGSLYVVGEARTGLNLNPEPVDILASGSSVE